jgi:signal transduction histidine kinase/ActR/RegA family two-component response regulator
MQPLPSLTHSASLATVMQRGTAGGSLAGGETAWQALPRAARLYVAGVVILGAVGFVAFLPRSFPEPLLFAMLLVFACVTSAWKVNLPIAILSGSTLSVSYAANLMSLLLLGPGHGIVIAVAGAWTQCKYKPKEAYPLYRTVFSAAVIVITMIATWAAYWSLGGPTVPTEPFELARPVVGAIAAYFVVNTGLIAGAIALSTGRSFSSTWREDFLWSGASFMFAGSAGALAAVVVARGEHWKAVLLVAPIYLTYRTYELFVARLEDQAQHTAEVQRLHESTIEALSQAREAERALAGEKERLANALANMTRLEDARNQLLEREQAARAIAEEANRLKDQFLAIVSHELRTPLNAILGWSEMLRDGRLDGPVRNRAFRAISDSARRQAQLIEDLLDVARSTSGKLRLERAVVELKDVVHEALLVVQPSADAKQMQITVDAEASPLVVYGDSARLQQIAWNLLSNAVKFTPAGGAVHVRLQRAGSGVEMAVRDTGQGIPRDFLPSVFEPFRQADGSTTRMHAGLGLGLSIVKTLVEAHGGTVRVQSDGEGRGATFTVRFPIAVGADAFTSISSPDKPARTMQSLAGVSVLLVDDDEDSREVIAAHLQGYEAAVLTAASVAEALEVVQRHHVDVLLADIGMPEEDGYSLIRRLRASEVPHIASIPAAALTAFAAEEDRQEALRAGFHLHLAKPVGARSLVTAVASLCSVARDA